MSYSVIELAERQVTAWCVNAHGCTSIAAQIWALIAHKGLKLMPCPVVCKSAENQSKCPSPSQTSL